MKKEENVTFKEYTLLVNEMNRLHQETKQELNNFKNEVNNRFDKMDADINDLKTDMKVIKNLLLQMVENNGLKAVK